MIYSILRSKNVEISFYSRLTMLNCLLLNLDADVTFVDNQS